MQSTNYKIRPTQLPHSHFAFQPIYRMSQARLYQTSSSVSKKKKKKKKK